MRIRIVFENLSLIIKLEKDTLVEEILSFCKNLNLLKIKKNSSLLLLNEESAILDKNKLIIIKYDFFSQINFSSPSKITRKNNKEDKENKQNKGNNKIRDTYFLLVIDNQSNTKLKTESDFYFNNKKSNSNISDLIMKTTGAKEKYVQPQNQSRHSLFFQEYEFPSINSIIDNFENGNNLNINPVFDLNRFHFEFVSNYFSQRNRSIENPLISQSESEFSSPYNYNQNQPNINFVNILVDFGFSGEMSRRALTFTNNDLTSATELILGGGLNEEIKYILKVNKYSIPNNQNLSPNQIENARISPNRNSYNNEGNNRLNSIESEEEYLNEEEEYEQEDNISEYSLNSDQENSNQFFSGDSSLSSNSH